MGRITFTADEQHECIIEEIEDRDDVESQAAAVRECITGYADLQQRVEELQQNLEDTRQRRDELRDQLQATNQRIEQHQELVEYVDYEKERQRAREEAGALTRLKWWAFGRQIAD